MFKEYYNQLKETLLRGKKVNVNETFCQWKIQNYLESFGMNEVSNE